jgi:amino acid transporter
VSLLDLLLGRPLATHEEGAQRVGVLAGIPMLGLDALASAAYGPEAALTVLIPLGAAGLGYIGPITGVIIVLLVIVFFSYRQTIAAYPTGGGSYTVARENLGVLPGLIAAAALLLDYVLVVAVGISAGVGALVSALPALQPYMLLLCLAILALIAVVNLRGVRESGVAFVLPTYGFVLCMFGVLAAGLAKLILSGGHPVPVVAPPALSAASAGAGLWLVLHAFSSGCTAMTGVEAVSNGVSAFQSPAVTYARRTLTIIIGVLILMLAGIALLANAYGIGATAPGVTGYQSVLSQLVAAIVGKGLIYYLAIGSTLAVLALSANTGFADFPRLCKVIAHDNFLPHAMASRGRRLVFSQGILVLTVLAALLLIAFDGITDRLIPLFAVGAFLAFTLSQAGMVVHWRRVGGAHAWRNMLINGVGALATAITLLVVLVAKFSEGAWITLLFIPCVIAIFLAIHRHYSGVARAVASVEPLDLSELRPPLVVVPMRDWNKMSHKALRFALKLSPDILVVQIGTHDDDNPLQSRWQEYVEEPARAAGKPVPQLVIVESPYRRLFDPLMRYIFDLKDLHPERQIAVIVSELVETHWYHYVLHKQRAAVLRTLLLFGGDQRIVVISVPWYLHG